MKEEDRMTHQITTYEDHDGRTVYTVLADGDDLNAYGPMSDPIYTVEDLADFVRELHGVGAFDVATRERLLGDVRDLVEAE